MRAKGQTSGMRSFGASLIALWIALVPAFAQDLTALARLDPGQTTFSQTGAEIEIALGLSQPVPWRVRLLSEPPRLIVDFRELDFAGLRALPIATDKIKAVRAGLFRSGWSRLVLLLDGPYRVTLAEMDTGAAVTQVRVRLTPTDADAFAREAALPEPPDWVLPKPTVIAPKADRKEGPIVVVLDPGHGGIDPGAERAGHNEADLMLGFARALKDLLQRTGSFEVVMTRDEDVFVPLETRISIARTAGADVFISLHADALLEGEAVGAAIYTLSEEASEEAAAALAERHDRDDLLAGLDLTGQDDLVAKILMDMARTETMPRTARLAFALEEAIKTADLKMHRVPQQAAGFSVLKSPDFPSVLIELGFLSSTRDLARLSDKKWRERMAEAIRDALLIWAQEDEALQSLRQR